MLRIGLDCDQVLADFMGTYLKRFGETTQQEITFNCLNTLKYDKEFWINLPLLRSPDFDVTLYCTKRVNPKNYTRDWLRKHNLQDGPIYQVKNYEDKKSRFIKGRIDVFIDDDKYNVLEMNLAGVPCLLMDSPYNRDWDTPLRIFSLKYNEIKSAYIKNFKQRDPSDTNYTSN